MRAVTQEGVSRSQGQVETQERKGLFSPAKELRGCPAWEFYQKVGRGLSDASV